MSSSCIWPIHFLHLDLLLSAKDLDVAVELHLIYANDVVFKIVEEAKLIFHVVVGDDPVLKLVVLLKFIALAAAASQYRVDKEKRCTYGYENHMLQAIDD